MFDVIFTFFLAIAILAVALALSVAITLPFAGALVRWRANYNPLAVGLDQESRVGPTLTSLFGTMKRIKRLEGWQGLWKGMYPTLLYSTLLSVLSIIFVGGSATKGPKNSYSVPEAGGISMAIFSMLLAIISLPMTIIINRAIITPYKLPNSAKGSLRILLTPLELSKPYMLYMTPGLLATTLTHVVCATLLARTMRIFFLGISSVTDDETVRNIAWWRWFLYLAWQCLSTLWFTPLEVIATRLSVQPNNSSDALSTEEEAPEDISFCGAGEDVIGLRPSTEPYLGMVDCARKIIEEEGWASLYRGFLFTMLGSVFGSTM
ncbi:hypothetical protein I315_02177 [Cryptococcus gattii Ru294]|uniref:Mitochondrial carrier protein n=2 Tax=Cryptococcus gattii TaxID=37769 RepID=E6R3D7_CRYGW|nr:Hypothetical Protein CGB_C4220W [Cryptococcus gattii WM276]KIR55588.1 hypothetical protein I315_02177 [Cryptococcus gattii Ru294]KIR82088.1 hypothetical protein I306_00821 [Cryptococcus gattii EJB2]KIY31177.1 hypothetical protein I305_06466 [Cryptococcus gattii E566]KJD99851.1 hypothetical protein I311_06560 [Cryptococcus gattii NT-10]ADV21006.1 Hypothetical Protein CGB_C4220W [Cryptococcus gattii WM276]